MTAALRHLVFDAKSGLAQRSVRRAFREMLAAESTPPPEVEARQVAATMAMARHAYRSTVFYRELYDAAGLRDDDLRDPAAVTALPVVDKAMLRDAGTGLVAADSVAADRLPSATGGSTGQPLVVQHDRGAPVAAMWWRVYGWWGVHPGDDKAFVQRDRRSPSARRRERIEWWPTRHTTLDATTMTATSIRDFLGGLQRRRTPLLNGYVGGVHELALEAARTGRRIPGLRAVGVTAAPVTASQRAEIESALGAPVHDQYRSAEVPWMAAECAERDGLHVLADLRRLELLDEQGAPADAGEVVVTDLTNRVFPLVRYRLGDRTAWRHGACRCGRSLPRITAVQGRVSDVLRLPDGQRVSGGLTGLFNARPDAVSQFQVVQAADRSVRLRWVRGPATDADSAVDEVVQVLRRMVRDQVPVMAEESPTAIAHDGGKFRVVVSEVADV